jgi:hypothetical protein
MSVQDAARELVAVAKEWSLDDFALIADVMLEDASPRQIDAVSAHLPDVLRELLPKRTLH